MPSDQTPLRHRDAALPTSVRPNDARINRKTFAASQPFFKAARQHLLEHEPQRVVVTEPAVPVLRERGVIRHLVFQTQPAEPAVRQVQMHFFAKLTL